jgi:hypothetical protein
LPSELIVLILLALPSELIVLILLALPSELILLKVVLNTIKTNKHKSKTTNDLLVDIAEEKVYLALNNNH